MITDSILKNGKKGLRTQKVVHNCQFDAIMARSEYLASSDLKDMKIVLELFKCI